MDETTEPTKVGEMDFEQIIQARINTVVSEKTTETRNNCFGSMQIALTKALQDAITDNVVSDDEATGIFNDVARNLQQDWDEPSWTKTFKISISCDYSVIMEVEVEDCDDEESAIDYVKEHLDFTPERLRGTLNYMGEESDFTMDSPDLGYSFDITEVLDFEAEEV